MNKNGTGGLLWPLKSASGENPSLTAGQPVTFECNDLPDRAPTGPLALFLAFVALTLAGTLTQSGATGVAIPRDRLPGLLISSIDWTNAFHGTVLSANYVTGTRLPIIEFVAGGFQYGQRQSNQILAANGSYAFSMTLALPALNSRRGRLFKDTSHLSLLFQPSHLKVNVAPTATLTAFSPGASLSSFTAKATAVLMPRQELVCGTPMEWVLHQITAGGNAVKINGFGRDTALTGVKAKGGVASLLELTLVNGQGGVITPSNWTKFSFQWRGQGEITAIQEYVDMMISGLPNDRPQVSATTNAGAAGVNDRVGFPFSQANLVGSSTANPDTDAILVFPIVLGATDLQLTDLQTAQTDQTFYATETGGFAAGDHLILGEYAKELEPEKRGDWLAQILDGGDNSLASYVLGGMTEVNRALKRGRVAGLNQRLPKDRHVVTADQMTYLPWQLA